MDRSNKLKLLNQNGIIATKSGIDHFSFYFENLQLKCMQAYFCELMDLHRHTKKRDIMKIKRELCREVKESFVFVICLN